MALLVLADDVSGAADAAAWVFGAGAHATIHLAPDSVLSRVGSHLYCTDSRHVSADEARRRLASTLAPLIHAKRFAPAVWCKKVDSLLRGNLGAEIEEMVTLLDAPCALIAPALPAMGRGLVGGRLTGVAAPVSLAERLAEQTALSSNLIPLEVVRKGPAALAATLLAARADARLLLVDAVTDADLDAIAEASKAIPAALPCGSSALIGAIARAEGAHAAFVDGEWPPLRGTAIGQREPPRVLAVVGSASVEARAQIRRATQEGFACTVIGRDLLPVEWNGSLVLCLPPVDRLPPPAEARLAVERLAEAALTVIEREASQRDPIDRLVIAGGDTAAVLLSRLGMRTLGVARVVQPGMPLLRTVGAHPDHAWHLILKAGSHGDAHTLLDLIRTLQAA